MKLSFAKLLLATCLLFAPACNAQTETKAPQSQDTQTSLATASVPAIADIVSQAPNSAWRELDLENTLYIETTYGTMVIELYPEMAPKHVEQIKTLARQKFYDYITFHRVIEDFMNQTGDPKGDGTGDSDLPNLEAEFTFRRATDMGVTLVGAQRLNPDDPQSGEIGVGFYKAMPVATQPAAQAMMTTDGRVSAFGLHCKGVTSMARASDPNSANSQFFIMRDEASHLNAQYTIWGTTVYGHDVVTAIKVGTVGEGSGFVPDSMETVRVAADLPEDEQISVQVMKTDSPAFKTYLNTLKDEDGNYPSICDIQVPSRLVPSEG